ncbi:MAG TPA: COX15/CtaA family protein [Stellaceae bacterium]|nr:COX15/CtaA family protein [Stellaceae bacterium]
MTIAATAEPAPRVAGSPRPIAYWLIASAVLILAMIVIGGITRLTESGLSITEWKPITGILPPLSERAWIAEFERYQQIPQYRAMNLGMTLDAFKTIYAWEYVHRLLGRLIGVVFAVPLLIFLLQGRVTRRMVPRLLGLLVLGGLQGVLGWYMVKSGLANRVDVSQYRLTAHLGLAVLIYAALVWQAADLLRREPLWLEGVCVRRFRRAAAAVVCLAFLTMLAGGFVAGLHAGLTYNTFPLMDGKLIPGGYFIQTPWWSNWFENVATVQFDHRLLATLTFVGIAAFWAVAQRFPLPKTVRRPLNAMMVMALVQVALGISTLLLQVPIALAAAHQAGAVLLLTFALLTLHGLKQSQGVRGTSERLCYRRL